MKLIHSSGEPGGNVKDVACDGARCLLPSRSPSHRRGRMSAQSSRLERPMVHRSARVPHSRYPCQCGLVKRGSAKLDPCEGLDSRARREKGVSLRGCSPIVAPWGFVPAQWDEAAKRDDKRGLSPRVLYPSDTPVVFIRLSWILMVSS